MAHTATSACRPSIPRCRRYSEKRVTGRRFSASGISAVFRILDRSRAATIISGDSAEASSTTSRTSTGGAQSDTDDLWDDDVKIHADWLPDGSARPTKPIKSIDGYVKQRKAILHQPAFQCAALALGGSGRRGAVADADQPRRLRCRHAQDLRPHGWRDGSAGRPHIKGA